MKKVSLLFVIVIIFTLTGCAKKYSYTDEQSDEAAEYNGTVIAGE